MEEILMYPLKFEPLFKDYLWGGRNLDRFGKKLPDNQIAAESWEVSCHPAGPSVIANGAFAGMSLADLIKCYPTEILGSAVLLKYGTKFPLLVKLIDANQQLSVQVHPDDAYALAHEDDFGKHEIWYILAAKPGAQIIYGMVPGTTKTEFARCLERGEVESCLNYQPVTAGDVIDIPPGTVHALGAGLILAEIQQNSNATYRVFDYNRVDATGKPRPLHIQKALEVIDFSDATLPRQFSNQPLLNESPTTAQTTLTQNFHFRVDWAQITGEIRERSGGDRFYIYTVLSGAGSLIWAGEQIGIKQGDSLLIPATLGEYRLKGPITVLKSYATSKMKIIGVGIGIL
jgi:mannose-6-phosphate isomerase